MNRVRSVDTNSALQGFFRLPKTTYVVRSNQMKYGNAMRTWQTFIHYQDTLSKNIAYMLKRESRCLLENPCFLQKGAHIVGKTLVL